MSETIIGVNITMSEMNLQKPNAWRVFWKENWLVILVVLGLAAAYLILRTPGQAFASTEELQVQLQSGQSVVVEFYSNSCSICLISKPKVDRLEAELEGQATVLRLNVKDPVVQPLAVAWRVYGVPAFFVVAGDGTPVYARAGAPDSDGIKAAVLALTAGD